ncbi:FliH/SctL family protein [Bradyrhizobium elkanii]|uniref:FliH/SctL family protein n=1 Tax=Bradyrhizobium elkanii TaxID=29448 RepID=UPI002227B1C1|nr:FliH/SctL family protein [Bradyrhizobium elkanii]MCW2130701.1 type III secretion protein L [Bradyrhizobium elkanii]MCW2175857.1 type III secretion protein L [Bradyrhizobium elkanii]
MVALVQLTSGSTSIFGPGRVLPAASAQTIVDAGQLLTQARRDAEALVDAARETVGMIETAAKEAALKAAQATIEQRLTAIAVASLRIMDENQERIVDMGLQIARRVIDTIAPDDAAVQIALQSLRFTGHSSLVRLRVAPAHVEAVRGRLNELLSTATSRAVVELVSDPRIKDAGCILETDAGLIDATIESQLAAIEAGLRNSLEASAT